MVLYRKYRPQKISELDSEEVKKRLTHILSSSYIPHAFLFAGPKGTGKTSAARIVAKILNCEKKTDDKKQKNPQPTTKNIEPCNSCETCVAITEGRNLDVIEIDAASHRGIDEIRELREKIKFAPVSSPFKVYIVDEVHMLTNEAFNALLKTLEEPPSHAIFILATTEAERLPETIISRCIIFNFHKATVEEMVHCLKRVTAGEKLTFSEDLLTLIAGAADGSFRDATKMLEQCILENITTGEKFVQLVGKGGSFIEEFLRLLSGKDTKIILKAISQKAADGINFNYFVTDLLNLLHGILLAQHGLEKEKVTPDLVELFSKNDILSLIKLFSRVYVELKNTDIPQLPFEVAVVEWCTKGGGNV